MPYFKVYGLNDIIDAVKNGHIDLLLVSEGHKLGGGYARNASFSIPAMMTIGVISSRISSSK